MVILYMHGMASSHESFTAACIRKYMPDAEVLAPDLSIDPAIAFPQIDEILKNNKVDVIVGHSLGGFMAQKCRGYKKVLVNPSLGVSYFQLFKGDNKYKHQRYDGVQTWHVDDRICKQYKEMEYKQYDGLTKEEDDITIGLFAWWDIVTRMSSHWFIKHYSHRQFIPGLHFPSENTVRDYIVPAINKLYQQG
ncbi:MAG: hypothetical protein MJZ13_00590 [Bacteroidales bacterium]|nr:hypothetical protein [Bacteroidales bacterium]